MREFHEALDKAGVPNTISTYKGEGHAFWTNMDQVPSLSVLHDFLYLGFKTLFIGDRRPNKIVFCDSLSSPFI